jgi:hypothetical protein
MAYPRSRKSARPRHSRCRLQHLPRGPSGWQPSCATFFSVPSCSSLRLAPATCTALGLALIPKDRAFAAAHPAQMLSLGRLVSRWTYILLYGLALVRIGLYLCEGRAPVSSLDDFQFYIVASVAPLWVIRSAVLARPLSQGAPGHARVGVARRSAGALITRTRRVAPRR